MFHKRKLLNQVFQSHIKTILYKIWENVNAKLNFFKKNSKWFANM